jgi:arsenite-transporting ATPase
VLRAPYLDEEVVGPAALDRLGEALFGGIEAHAVMHRAVSQRLVVDPDGATFSLELPFAQRGEVSVRKIDLELVLRVGAMKRTILLPPALADYRPAGAAFADGVLQVDFVARRG